LETSFVEPLRVHRTATGYPPGRPSAGAGFCASAVGPGAAPPSGALALRLRLPGWGGPGMPSWLAGDDGGAGGGTTGFGVLVLLLGDADCPAEWRPSGADLGGRRLGRRHLKAGSAAIVSRSS